MVVDIHIGFLLQLNLFRPAVLILLPIQPSAVAVLSCHLCRR